MKLSDLFRIIRKNFLILIFFPVLLSSLVFYQTRDQEKEYTSSFLVYTGIASGLTITTEQNPRIDHNTVNNAFDNLLTTLKARESMEEVGIRLLASHLMLDKSDPAIISAKSFNHLKEILPDSIRSKVKKSKSNGEAIDMLYNYKYSSGNNPVKNIINSGEEVYGVPFISSKITAKRKDLSDMLEVFYVVNDPAICQQTLEILSDVFIRRYREIKRGEINRVVAYFEKETKNTQLRLKEAEDKVKDFEIKYKIINFDEQTKSISASKQNLEDNIEKENLILTGAQSTIKNLESKINMRQGLMETNEKIVEKRKLLSELNYKIANASISKTDENKIAQMQLEAERIKNEIKNVVTDLYKINNSTEGMPRTDLVAQWLSNILIADESAARLKVMQSRLGEFDQVYNDYAPLGAILSRLNREVAVAEKQYLDQLNAFNINKQRQQNIEMESNIKIVDKPYYPLQPEGSKRIILVIGSFIAGFILIFSGFICVELFDHSIKTSGRAEELSGLKVLGMMPVVKIREKKYDLEYMESSLLEQTISALSIEMKERKINTDPKLIMISSANPEEGKTWCAYKLAYKLSEIKGRVLLLYPHSENKGKDEMKEFRLADPKLELVEYEVKKDLLNREKVEELLDKQMDLNQFSFVLIETPPLMDHQLPVELVKKMHITLLVLRADRSWSEKDTYVTKLLSKASSYEPLVILNRVSLDTLVGVFGKIPKRNVKKKQVLVPKENKGDFESNATVKI